MEARAQYDPCPMAASKLWAVERAVDRTQAGPAGEGAPEQVAGGRLSVHTCALCTRTRGITSSLGPPLDTGPRVSPLLPGRPLSGDSGADTWLPVPVSGPFRHVP